MTPLVLLALATGSCITLDSSAGQVTAGDLARAWPALAAAPPATPLGYPPRPGVERVFPPRELRRLGLRLGVEDEPDAAICVALRTAAPDPARWLEVMRRALGEARIDLLDYSRSPAPEGEVVFPRSALQASGRWNGYVVYARSGRFPVWAVVKARITATRVVASTALRAGGVIAASQVRLETVEVPPGAETSAASLEEVVGRVARRTVPAQAPVPRSALGEAPAVRRGESVKVEVQQGAARLELWARAEADGRRGDRIAVRNPETKKRFLVRVEGNGRVVAGEAGEER
jgi:flagella basal body P-ring formation protein FlgA